MNLTDYFHGRSPALPQVLTLATGQSLQLLEWLRVLPNKRYVARATLQDKTVLIKIYLGKKARSHYLRELAGANILSSQQINSPACLQYGETNDFSYILFEFLTPAISLLEQWQNAQCAEKEAVLKDALIMISQMHKKGFWQADLHLDNFLLYEQELFVIDVASIKTEQLGQGLSAKHATENLAVLFAQLPIQIDKNLSEILLSYDAQTIDTKELKKRIKHMRAWRLKDYMEKTARDCSLFFYQKTARFVQAGVRAEQDVMQVLLNDPDSLIEQGHIYKTGGTATVARVMLDDTPWVIKRYNIKSFKHWLKRFWRPSRAWHSWQAGHMLDLLGIATAVPTAIKEQRWFGLRFKSWLITPYCGEQSLKEHFAPFIQTGAVPEAEIQQLVQLFNQLITAQISHGDLKAINLFWYQQRCVLIDLDAVKKHRQQKSFIKAFNKDRARLLRNWPEDSALYQVLDSRLPRL